MRMVYNMCIGEGARSARLKVHRSHASFKCM